MYDSKSKRAEEFIGDEEIEKPLPLQGRTGTTSL
jgi:hypothetical protein